MFSNLEGIPTIKHSLSGFLETLAWAVIKWPADVSMRIRACFSYTSVSKSAKDPWGHSSNLMLLSWRVKQNKKTRCVSVWLTVMEALQRSCLSANWGWLAGTLCLSASPQGSDSLKTDPKQGRLLDKGSQNPGDQLPLGFPSKTIQKGHPSPPFFAKHCQGSKMKSFTHPNRGSGVKRGKTTH